MNQAILELLKFKKNVVKCKKCKHLIEKEDAIDGGDEIMVKCHRDKYNLFFYTYEKYIAETFLCPRCAAEKKAESEMTASEANKVTKKNAKRN